MNKKLIISTAILIVAITFIQFLFLGAPLKVVGLANKDINAALSDKNTQNLVISSKEGSSFKLNLPKGITQDKLVIGLYDPDSEEDFGEALDIADRFIDDNPTFTKIKLKNRSLVLKGSKLNGRLVRYWLVSPDGKVSVAELKDSQDVTSSINKPVQQSVLTKSVFEPGKSFYRAATANLSALKGSRLFSAKAAEVASLIVLPTAPIKFDFIKNSEGLDVLKGTLHEGILDNQNLILALGNAPNSKKNARKLSVMRGNGTSFSSGVSYRLVASASEPSSLALASGAERFDAKICSDDLLNPDSVTLPKGYESTGIEAYLDDHGCCENKIPEGLKATAINPIKRKCLTLEQFAL